MKEFLKKHLHPRLLIQLIACDQYLNGPVILKLIPRLSSKDRVAVDVGANIGAFTYFMRRHASHVHAYEPNPELALNLRRAFGSGVSVHDCGLSNQSGTAILRVPQFDGVEAHGLGSIAQTFNDAEVTRDVQVPLKTLDDENLGDIGFMKIDVEQHEKEMLEGAMKTIAAHRPNLLIEVTPKLYDCSLPEYFSDLLALGYKCWFVFGRRLLPLDSYDVEIHNNSANYDGAGPYVSNLVFAMEQMDDKF